VADRVPRLRQVVLDTTDARALAEFYRRLLGFSYRPGDGDDWVVLNDASGVPRLAFQQVGSLPPPTWPDGPRPQMLHLDLTVETVAELDEQHERAIPGCAAAGRPRGRSGGAAAGVRGSGGPPVLHLRRLTSPYPERFPGMTDV
jgi:hypothetical protein